ncbi:MAG: protein MpaA [Planctomycetota bacterium]|jgi:protein MpaA
MIKSISTRANRRVRIVQESSTFLGFCFLALTSCQSTSNTGAPGEPISREPTPEVAVSQAVAGSGNLIEGAEPIAAAVGPAGFAIGRSSEQRPITAHFLGDGPEVVLFLATIHGDESAGTALLERLAVELYADPQVLQGKRAIIVPVVNPDGYAAGRRSNANRVDLNRNFPAENQADAKRGGERPLSEPEARVIAGLVDLHKPWRAVSIHQPLNCVDFDGPATELAAAMSEACGLPVKRLGGRPGSLGTWLGQERGIPTITLELPRRVDADPEAHWERYGPALLAFLAGA